MIAIRISLRIISGIGAMVFLAGFLVTFASQQYLEGHARAYIEEEVREVVARRVDSLKAKTPSGMLSALSDRYEKRVRELEEELVEGLDKRLEGIFALMGDPSCECRKWLRESHRQALKSELMLERNKAEVVRTLMMAGYGEVVDKLRTDFRIFTLSSFFAFLLVMLATFLKPAAAAQLLLPSALLIPSTLVAAWFYLFEQDWFYTILTNSYVGLGYTAGLLVIFVFLADVLFNRARVTSQIINGMAQSVGSAFSVMPC